MTDEPAEQRLGEPQPTSMPTGDPPPAPRLARNAGLLFLGSMASRVLGLVREMVIAYLFGASGQVSAFRVAAQVPTMLYEFLVGGMLSAALVPVLSEYLRTRTRAEFARLAGTLIGVFSIVLALVVIFLEVTAPLVAQLLAGGFDEFDPTLLPLTVRLIRLVTPAVWLFSMAGVLTAILYAHERFSVPALATALYNLGIVVAAPLLAARLGVISLAVGILVGSMTQLLVIGWDLRRSDVHPRIRIDLRRPALRKIVLLYAPIAAGLVVALFQVGLDRRLASTTGAQSIAWMANATTLQQMPLGLISVAIALASLPRLSQYYAARDEISYRRTLGQGLRMVLLLILPSAVLLWILGEPITRLLFQRGDFLASDTTQVARALNIYVLGMLFAAVDFPLNFAFYARNNTLLPALVGVMSVGIYVVVALVLLPRLGYLGLVWADTAKQAGHALVMLWMLRRRVGQLGDDMARASLLLIVASAVMALTLGVATRIVGSPLPDAAWPTLIVHIGLLATLGLFVYVGALVAGGSQDAKFVWLQLRTRLRRPI